MAGSRTGLSSEVVARLVALASKPKIVIVHNQPQRMEVKIAKDPLKKHKLATQILVLILGLRVLELKDSLLRNVHGSFGERESSAFIPIQC